MEKGFREEEYQRIEKLPLNKLKTLGLAKIPLTPNPPFCIFNSPQSEFLSMVYSIYPQANSYQFNL